MEWPAGHEYCAFESVDDGSLNLHPKKQVKENENFQITLTL